jgi:hypothetical protein
MGYLIYGKALGKIDHGILIAPLLLTGYAVWVGWGLRSRGPMNRIVCGVIWLASAGYNVMQPVHAWMDSHDPWILLVPLPLWGIVTTSASLIALVLEFFRPKCEIEATVTPQ